MNGKNLQKCSNGSSEGTILVSRETEENKILRVIVTWLRSEPGMLPVEVYSVTATSTYDGMGGENIGNKTDVKTPYQNKHCGSLTNMSISIHSNLFDRPYNIIDVTPFLHFK